MNFDRIIIDHCLTSMETVNNGLKNLDFPITNPMYLLDNAIKSLKNIRQNNSLRIKYQSIFNSCLVLQVSYFSSIVTDIFRYVFNYLVMVNKLPKNDDSLKFSIDELVNYEFELYEVMADVIN